MDLAPVLSKLDSVRRRARSLIVLDGACRALLILILAALFSFAVDYFIPKVPLQVRITVLVAGLGSTAAALWRFVAIPLRIALSDDDLALCVERQYPDLHDRLISALQLSREGGRFSSFNSPELVQALVRDAMRESDALDFSPVVIPAGPIKLAAWTAAALIAVAGLAAWQSNLVRIWAARLVSDSVQWPKKTHILVLSPTGNPVTVAKGDDLLVEIRTDGAAPRKAVISYRFSETGEPIQRPMRTDLGGQFHYEFSKVIEPLQFWIEAGDDEVGPIAVQVLNPPTVERIALLYDYPEYTGLRDTDPTAPVEDGNIVAPIGTRVHISAQANLDISAAKIQFGRRGEDDVRDLSIQPDAQGRPRLVSTDVDVLTNNHYAIWLRATNGLQTSAPVRYTIKATEDKAPEIRIHEPNLDKHCTPVARIPIRFTTSDDFGVTGLSLSIRTNDPKRPEQTIPLDAFNTESYPSKRIETEYWFDMAEFGAKEQMIITYQLIAHDGREIPKANETRSRVFQFTVIKKDDMLKRIEDMLSRIREELRRIISFQEAGRTEVARLMDVLGEKDLLETMERQAVNGSAANQRRITQHLERVLLEFNEIVKDMKYNKLLEGASQEKLKKPGDLLEAVTKEKSPQAADVLAQAPNVGQGKERMSRLADAAARQDDIVKDLNVVLTLLTEYETYLEVVRYVRDMYNKANGTLQEMRKTNPK